MQSSKTFCGLHGEAFEQTVEWPVKWDTLNHTWHLYDINISPEEVDNAVRCSGHKYENDLKHPSGNWVTPKCNSK